MRRREISPDFFTDERVVQASEAAQILFIGLWCLADRNGVLADNPLVIKLKILPARTYSAEPLLQELAELGLVTRYEVGQQRLLFLPGFAKHQRVHPREMKGVLPLPAKSAGPKANLGEPRLEIMPGSSGSSGPSGSIGSFGIVGQANPGAPSAPTPVGLDPEKPSRAPSEAQEWFSDYVDGARTKKLADDSGVPESEIEPLVQTDKLAAPYLNATVKRLLSWSKLPLCRDAAGEGYQGPTLSEVWWAYLDDPKNAGRDPPFSFRYFAAEGVFRKYLEQVQREVAA